MAIDILKQLFRKISFDEAGFKFVIMLLHLFPKDIPDHGGHTYRISM